ncbi:MAG: M24 family metallopeptidase [Thermomicrobiales bacterium]|nr:M24 family metallopeptidase [Thermomicrobiales bacterium]MCO5220686.1 M24 family metallopeptidase [Thermomicrobiales bacterium]
MSREWYSGTNRWERIQNAIERHNLDALLALTPENAHYLAGFGSYVATHWRLPGLFAVVIGKNGKKAIVSGEFGRDPGAPEPDYTVFPYTSWTESVDVRGLTGGSIAERTQQARPYAVERPAQFDLGEVFDRVGDAIRSVAPNARNVGVDLDLIDDRSVGYLVGVLGNALGLPWDSIFDDLRAIKDPDEIAQLRLACELAELGIGDVVKDLELDQSALAVNSAYHIAVHRAVTHDPRFAGFRQSEGLATVGLGTDAPGHVVPGQTIKFDMQVDIAGYHSDVGRTYAIDPTPDQQATYDALLGALHEMTAAVAPGITFAQLYAIGAGAMHRAGFANYSRGHLGHSDGLTQHFEEAPFIAPAEHRPLTPNMVLSLEMPYYLYGVGAFQLERMVLVTEDGHEVLDSLPFQLAVDR